MAGRVKTWVWVVAGIVVVCFLGVVAMAAVGMYLFTKHIDTREISPASASQEFEEIKARFKEQKPLIELDERGHLLRSNPDRATAPNATRPEHLNVLAFDPDDNRIVKVTIPFWLLRLKMRGTMIDFNGSKMDLDDLKLTVEELERFGPTLIVDHKTSSGERVLVWSQ
jgi:hypothetical protein